MARRPCETVPGKTGRFRSSSRKCARFCRSTLTPSKTRASLAPCRVECSAHGGTDCAQTQGSSSGRRARDEVIYGLLRGTSKSFLQTATGRDHVKGSHPTSRSSLASSLRALAARHECVCIGVSTASTLVMTLWHKHMLLDDWATGSASRHAVSRPGARSGPLTKGAGSLASSACVCRGSTP